MKKMQGFTLIEILIALVIIGILAGIAIPNYSDYVLKAKRSDAHTALANMASALEDFYANNQYVYTNVVANVGGPNSQEGYYILSITMPASADSYTLTATATGSQIADTPCLVMTLTSTGIKGPVDANGDPICW